MIKLNVCATRLPGMTRSEYIRYVKDNHVRVIAEQEPVWSRMSAYVQQHVFDAAYGAEAPQWRWDSVSHIYAASPEALEAAMSTREYREHIAPDELRFSDTRSVMFNLLQEELLPLPVRGPSAHRLLHYGKCKEGASEGLARRWSEAHSQVLTEAPQLFRSVRRAVINSVAPTPGQAPAFDGMMELGFLDRSDAAAMGDYVDMMQERLASVLDKERSFFLLCDAVPIRGALW